MNRATTPTIICTFPVTEDLTLCTGVYVTLSQGGTKITKSGGVVNELQKPPETASGKDDAG